MMFTRQPTESYESIVVLFIEKFIDCPCLCVDSCVLDSVLRGDNDGDDFYAFPLTRLAAIVAVPRQAGIVDSHDTVLLTMNDFAALYAQAET